MLSLTFQYPPPPPHHHTQGPANEDLGVPKLAWLKNGDFRVTRTTPGDPWALLGIHSVTMGVHTKPWGAL